MAKSGESTPRATSGSGMIVACGLMIVMGGSAGAGFALLTRSDPNDRPQTAAVGVRESKRPASDASVKSGRDRSTEHIVPLDPIIVGLAGPDNRWLRLEGAIVLSEPPEADRVTLPKQIAQDLLGFLRRTSMTQLETAAGLEFPRDDLAELVRLRSRGRARDIIIRTLVVE